LKLTFWSNWVLFLVNILPALPLDGGRALCCGLRPVLSDVKATAAVARGGLIVTVIGLSIWSWLSQNPNETPLVPIWLPLSLLIIYLVFTARNEMARLDDDDRDGDLLGYDFSQGYTSLERGGESPRRREPNVVQKWLERRREEKRRRAREIEQEEERRVDEILARVKDIGLEALSPDERALLHRVSERYRNRQGHP
jgi:stage IV sporulation protein FB